MVPTQKVMFSTMKDTVCLCQMFYNETLRQSTTASKHCTMIELMTHRPFAMVYLPVIKPIFMTSNTAFLCDLFLK